MYPIETSIVLCAVDWTQKNADIKSAYNIYYPFFDIATTDRSKAISEAVIDISVNAVIIAIFIPPYLLICIQCACIHHTQVSR